MTRATLGSTPFWSYLDSAAALDAKPPPISTKHPPPPSPKPPPRPPFAPPRRPPPPPLLSRLMSWLGPPGKVCHDTPATGKELILSAVLLFLVPHSYWDFEDDLRGLLP